MGSSDRNGRPIAGRKSTFQRMLDLEKKNKVNHLQASRLMPLRRSTSTSTSRRQDAITNFNQYPPTLESTGRAMTTPAPALSISISQAAHSNTNGSSKKYIIRSGGDVVAQEEGVSDHDTDASSICHSPGWDDISGRKRKKEKREAKERKKRDKDRLEASKRPDLRIKSRLSKPPPNANSKFVKRLSIGVDRSFSEPDVPTIHNPTESSAKPKPAEEGCRSRRASLDLGVKALSSIIPNSWKSSNAPHTPIPAPIDGPVTSHEKPPFRGSFSHQRTISRNSIDNNGFIGGLKLRQAEEANVQETVRPIRIVSNQVQIQAPRPKTSRNPAPKTEGILNSDGSFVDGCTASIYDDQVRSSHHWDEIFSNAAKMASKSSLDPESEHGVPIMERNGKKTRKTNPPTSRYFPLDTDESTTTTRDSSIASHQTSMVSSLDSHESPVKSPENVMQHQKQSSSEFSDRLPVKSQHPSHTRPEIEISRGRRSTDYDPHERQPSQDIARSGLRKDECFESKTNRKESRGRRMSFGRRKNRDTTTSRENPIGRLPAREADPSPDNDIVESIRVEALLAPQKNHGQFARSRIDENNSNHHRRASSKIVLKGFRAAAKSAFTRIPAAIDSPPATESSSSASDSSSNRPTSSSRTLTDAILTPASAASKAERVLGELVPPSLVKSFGQRPYSSGRPFNSPDSIRAHLTIPTDAKLNDSGGRAFHARTVTDSSEEYSTLDEFSSVTTPTALRPNSQKNYKPSSKETSPEMPQLAVTLGNLMKLDAMSSPPVMSGGLAFDDGASARDSWCRTSKEPVLSDQEDEDRMTTPTGNTELPVNFLASFRNESTLKKTSPYRESSPIKMTPQAGSKSADHDRPSLPRSISTPDMQDLSFLPTLRHQALTRTEKASSDNIFAQTKKRNDSPSNSQGSAAELKSLMRPPTKVAPFDAKPEGAIPNAPSQYLQHARLNIQRPGPPKPSPGDQNGPEQIAKMFVVCCSCKYFHDMPSKIYECMTKPDNVVTDPNLGVSGIISTSVKCPWCGHGMSTACCAGYAAIVCLREKLH